MIDMLSSSVLYRIHTTSVMEDIVFAKSNISRTAMALKYVLRTVSSDITHEPKAEEQQQRGNELVHLDFIHSRCWHKNDQQRRTMTGGPQARGYSSRVKPLPN